MGVDPPPSNNTPESRLSRGEPPSTHPTETLWKHCRVTCIRDDFRTKNLLPARAKKISLFLTRDCFPACHKKGNSLSHFSEQRQREATEKRLGKHERETCLILFSVHCAENYFCFPPSTSSLSSFLRFPLVCFLLHLIPTFPKA